MNDKRTVQVVPLQQQHFFEIEKKRRKKCETKKRASNFIYVYYVWMSCIYDNSNVRTFIKMNIVNTTIVLYITPLASCLMWFIR